MTSLLYSHPLSNCETTIQFRDEQELHNALYVLVMTGMILTDDAEWILELLEDEVYHLVINHKTVIEVVDLF